MKRSNKWNYLLMNVCFIFSFLFYNTSSVVCSKLNPTFENGAIVGTAIMLGKILSILGFIFLFIIIENNSKKRRKKNESKN